MLDLLGIHIHNALRFMDAVARDDLGKGEIDKEVVEKVSKVFIYLLESNCNWPNELLYDCICLLL